MYITLYTQHTVQYTQNILHMYITLYIQQIVHMYITLYTHHTVHTAYCTRVHHAVHKNTVHTAYCTHVHNAVNRDRVYTDSALSLFCTYQTVYMYNVLNTETGRTTFTLSFTCYLTGTHVHQTVYRNRNVYMLHAQPHL